MHRAENLGIKCKYIAIEVLELLDEKRLLQIIKENKKLQMLMNRNIFDYKNNYKIFSSIEIEIKPSETLGKFINLDNKDEGEKEREKNYRIYFNDSKVEIKNKYYLDKSDKVTKIRILVGYKEKSFDQLFMECDGIESINFRKFYRNNIESMIDMFYECTSLKEINLKNFITDNVTDMSYMFSGCSSIKELNLNNFNTNNVTDMRYMFRGCSSLKELNLNNFNTNNVTNMYCMFYGCSSLKELNLNNFNTNNVTYMRWMFSKCSDELKLKIKSQFKNFKEGAFKN